MASDSSAREDESFRKTLKDNRMIQLYVGGDDTTGEPTSCISANMWMSLGGCFATDVEGGDEDDTLIVVDCDEGDKKSWEALLCWAYKRTLPTFITAAEDPIPLIQAWLLGEYYDYPAFQDVVMLELLRLDPNLEYGLRDIKDGFRDFDHDCGSQMRQFMAEIVVREIEVTKHMRSDDMGDLGAASGKRYLGEEMVKAYHRFLKHGEKIYDWFGKVEGSKARWSESMVDGGPKEHWVHQEKEGGGERKRRRFA